MTWAVDHPRSSRTRPTVVIPRLSTVGVAGPSSTAFIGFMTALFGAWAAIVGFVGPTFGYRVTTYGAWQWASDNWLLHLIPGALALAAGLLVLGQARSDTGAGVSLAGLAALVAGAWLVVGPVLWPWFEHSLAYRPASAVSGARFVIEVGANLGPGIILAMFGGMLLKASHPGAVAAVADDVVAPAPVADGTVVTVPAGASPPAGAPGAHYATTEPAQPAGIPAGEVVSPPPPDARS